MSYSNLLLSFLLYFTGTLVLKIFSKTTPLVKAVSRAKSAGFKGARCQTSASKLIVNNIKP